MIRLKEYLKPAKYQKVIEEKVSKKDIESAWKDKHVRLGAEFEYYDNDISEFDGGTNFENALDDYNELERNTESKRKELEAANEEYESGVRQELEDAISEKKDAINYEDDEDTKDDLQKELDDLERWLDDGDMQSFKELYGGDYYDGLNQVFDDVMMYNYPTVEDYDNYVEYLQMYDIDLHDVQTFIDEYIRDEVSWDHSRLPEPNPDYDSDSQLDNEQLEEILNNKNDLPFKSFQVGGYHSGSDEVHFGKDGTWRIEADSSLSEGKGGIEFISPVLNAQEMQKTIKDMFKYIQKNGETKGTNGETGLHISLSYDGTSMGKVDLLKLMLFLDEGYITQKTKDKDTGEYLYFPDRPFAEYLTGVQQQIRKKSNQEYDSNTGRGDMIKLNDPTAFKNIKDMFKEWKSRIPKNQHSNSVNFEHIDSGKASRIEIRWLGGKNYEKKEKQVLATIGHYIHAFKLAMDPEYMKEEYVKKLVRIMNKNQDSEQPWVDPDAPLKDKLLGKQKLRILKTGNVVKTWSYSKFMDLESNIRSIFNPKAAFEVERILAPPINAIHLIEYKNKYYLGMSSDRIPLHKMGVLIPFGDNKAEVKRKLKDFK